MESVDKEEVLTKNTLADEIGLTISHISLRKEKLRFLTTLDTRIVGRKFSDTRTHQSSRESESKTTDENTQN